MPTTERDEQRPALAARARARDRLARRRVLGLGQEGRTSLRRCRWCVTKEYRTEFRDLCFCNNKPACATSTRSYAPPSHSKELIEEEKMR